MTPIPAMAPPKPMIGLEPGSWAERTIKVRFIDTIKRTIAENDFPAEFLDRLDNLISEIPDDSIKDVIDPGAPDEDQWRTYLAGYEGQNWLQPPWFVVEHYFYRRIIDAVGYFQMGAGNGLDPFLASKKTGLEQSKTAISELAKRLESWLSFAEPTQEILKSILFADLWGNQADYSLWPADADEEQKPDHGDGVNASEFLLADDSSVFVDFIFQQSQRISCIDFLIDNAGMELLCDLVFVDYLLTANIAKKVQFHLKAHPTFVSDALPKDVEESVAYLEVADSSDVQKLGSRLRKHLDSKRLLMRPSFFWNSPLDGWLMPEDLRADLDKANLVFSKGDAHYRRLLGDRHWPDTTPFSDIVSYFPAPLVALRTLKSELVCGLQTGQAEKVATIDPEWMINGRWGLVQSNIQSTVAGTGVKK